ncbi:MAG: hypothetical protein IKD31_03890 [Clostridia bacterium]|nr:hypothetical protein [Clostridia bacterium]
MCNIAGYSGNRRAAPILIEMLRREQFMDGGLSTGIATIHEGKLYSAKVLGDVDELLRSTDALHFPGNCGIIHSRPAGNLRSHAHPFLDEDECCAVVLNGTMRGVGVPEFYEKSNRMIRPFYERGCVRTAYLPKKEPKRILPDGRSYHASEIYALLMGEQMKKNGCTEESAACALRYVFSEFPADIVVLSVHAAIPDTITFGTVSRPVCVGIAPEETYLATTALAFPEDAGIETVLPLPTCTIAQATPGKLNISGKKPRGVRVENISHRAAKIAYERLERILSGQKNDPKSIYDIPVYREWRDLWSEPLVDCQYCKEGDMLKPTASLFYEALWSFHKEGRLRGVLGEYKGRRIVKFWLD